MQPRLLGISYPSPPNDGHKQEGSRAQKKKSVLSWRLHDFPNTWQELGRQFRPRKQKESLDNESIWEVCFQPSTNRTCTTPRDLYKREYRWQRLPHSIRVGILEQLQLSYDCPSSAHAQQQWRNDLAAIQLSCTSWATEARQRLYENIQLKSTHTHDLSLGVLKVCSIRIIQLRRTLRSSPELAAIVKHLIILPDKQASQATRFSYSDLIASVVMACPNLQKLITFPALYTHSYDRLTHALSTRTSLTTHTWVIASDPLACSGADQRYGSDLLGTQQSHLFLQFHALWHNLSTLNILSHNGTGVLEHKLLVEAINMLPSLKHLHVSCLDANDFSDETMLQLPSLTSLRLDQCSGVTEFGLCEWACSPRAVGIQRLVLENQQITSLLSIARLFRSLPNLESFKLLQLAFAPGLPLYLEVQQPLFVCPTLKKIEWFSVSGQQLDTISYIHNDLPYHLRKQAEKWARSRISQHLLSSIINHGLPNLRTIVLSGHNDLNSLLRWIRHHSWISQNVRSISPTHELSTAAQLGSPASVKTPASNCNRNSGYFTLQPTRLDATENEHTTCRSWATELRPYIPRSPHALNFHPDVSPAPTPSVALSGTRVTNSPTGSENSDDSQSDTASISTSPSATAPSYVLSSRSSNSTMQQNIDRVSNGAAPVTISKGAHETTRPLPSDTKDSKVARSQHSSISVLLDDYTDTLVH